VRWEQRLAHTLLGRNEANRLYLKFVVDGLLRGDIKTRYEAYAIARNWGWMSRNDVREKEDMNPVDDGDDYLTPVNMTAGPPPTLEAGHGEDD
jgi:phage portal protein BeeE